MRKHYPLNSAGAEDAGQLPWIDGVPQTGAQGSFPGHAIVTDAEAEILNAQGLGGVVQSGTDLTQLAQVIARGLYLGGYNGSANALTATLAGNVSIPSLLVGMRFSGIVTTPNTGSVTVAIAGFGTSPGVLNLLRTDGQPLTAGDLPQNRPFDIRFDGAAFRLTSPAPSEITSSTTITNTIIQILNAKNIAGGQLFPFATAGSTDFPITANTTFSVGECRGGGGGGGGASGTSSAGSGGGGGGNAIKVGTATVDTVLTINVGAQGVGGAAGGGNGTAGGSTSIIVKSGRVTDTKGNAYGPGQTFCAATGGQGGYGASGTSTAGQSGAGGVGAGGDLNVNGDAGGLPQGQFTNNTFLGGRGGGSAGSGGQPDGNQGAAGNGSAAAGVGGNGSSNNAPGAYGALGSAKIYK